MTSILQKYKYYIIAVLSLLIIVSLAWVLATKTKANKIPSRGVFVMEDSLYNKII